MSDFAWLMLLLIVCTICATVRGVVRVMYGVDDE